MNQQWLNSKQIKHLAKIIEKQWGFTLKTDYRFLINNDGKVYVASDEVSHFDISNLKVNHIGLYIGRLILEEFKLSVEGTQIFGNLAQKNVLELDNNQVFDWLHGFEVKCEGSHHGFVIIKHEEDFHGCGRHKDGKVINLLPKERRIMSINDKKEITEDVVDSI
jgi:NOL1/NOP2/fmu family ribosome biogenesis protein